METFDLAVVIGRFQPCHLGHLQVIRSALEVSPHVLILLGSANLGRSTRNPFNAEERTRTLQNALEDYFPDKIDAISIRPLDDHPYDNIRWIAQVQRKVDEYCADLINNPRVGVVAHNRDESLEHARRFPHWGTIVPAGHIIHMNATDLRETYFQYGEGIRNSECSAWLPSASDRFLNRFAKTPEFADLKAEFQFNKQYARYWGTGPFMTVDNVVVQSGHVLVVERKKRPGMGKLAMPGGHLEVKETLDHGAIRELWEETKIFQNQNDYHELSLTETKEKIWPHYRAQQTFDAVNRSTRARVITTAFLFKLPDTPRFPEVKGSDDAARAFWLPISRVKPADFFEDHAFIIEKMLGVLG